MWREPCRVPCRSPFRDSLKVDVRLVLPMHSVIHEESLKPVGIYSSTAASPISRWKPLKACWMVCLSISSTATRSRTSGSVYSSNNKLDAEKYTFFSLAALELPRQINWQPNILHCNDWHTTLAAYGNLVKSWEDKNHVVSMITVHNLPFLGPDVKDIL